jgi:tryptophanyl-tRNA synthetase
LTTKKNRVLSGMRPTGKLHIGHYFGALQNWVRLQNDPSYECFYFIADWHALTSDYADTSAVAQNTIEIVTDYLAAGLDPTRDNCTIFQQSLIPEHAELHLLLGMVTPLSWLERVPTYKEAFENVTNKDLHTYGFLGYPCLQTADIVMYSEPGTPLFVPVGEDQVSHVEISREIVHRFNSFYGFEMDRAIDDRENLEFAGFIKAKLGIQADEPIRGPYTDVLSAIMSLNHLTIEPVARRRAQEIGFDNFLEEMGKAARFFNLVERLTEPDVMLTKTPRIPGLDGRKMSKSYGNAITLSESDDDIRKKTKVMVTDPARKRRTDPGNPDVCPVYDWHKLFSSPETLAWAAEGCRSASIGCIECKAKMADHLIEWITPIRERRLKYENDRSYVLKVIDEGSTRAREVAKGTMERVREAVFGWQKKRAEIKNS